MIKKAGLLLVLAAVAFGQNYKAERTTVDGLEVVRLTDAAHDMQFSVLPSVGNRGYELKVHGKNILYFPNTDLAQFKQRPGLNGIPFLAPWANRLSEQSFWANGKKYTFNMTLGNVRGQIPIHGMLQASPLWEVIDVGADAQSAHVTSRLQFWKSPDLMQQWPFAHEYEMTYSLSNGTLEVRLTVNNLSSEPMPLAVGFHPYYQIPDIPRDEWVAHIPAKKHVEAVNNLPTGEYTANDLPVPTPLKDRTFDDGFAELERDAQGRAHFSIEAQGKKVEIAFGPKYPVAVVWEPAIRPGQAGFVCFEPMTGITNAVNLNHDGKYPDLQSVPAGGSWTESFWISSSGI